MVNRKPLMVSFLCLALILAAFWLLRLTKNDTKQIKRHLSLLERMISLSPQSVPEPYLAKAREAKLLVSRDCQVFDQEDGLSGTYPPQKVAAYVVRFQAQVLKAHLSFYDIQITFPEKDVASIHCTARLKGEMKDHERFDEFRELRIKAVKIHGRWRFTRFRDIEAMEK